jgi:hypothetical protein
MASNEHMKTRKSKETDDGVTRGLGTDCSCRQRSLVRLHTEQLLYLWPHPRLGFPRFFQFCRFLFLVPLAFMTLVVLSHHGLLGLGISPQPTSNRLPLRRSGCLGKHGFGLALPEAKGLQTGLRSL